MSTPENDISMIGATESGEQYLTFTLDKEEFGIEILKVQEIKGLTHLTPIPNTPDYIKGVMNLRGTVVPVVDLRAKFNLATARYDNFTVIIIVNVGERIIGLVVDTVSDVLNVSSDAVEETPEFGGGIDANFLSGLAKSGDRLVSLLDIHELFESKEFGICAAG